MVTFEQFSSALKVFAGDYGIVGHPDLQPVAPWAEPNNDMYSMTQLPEGTTEDQVVEHLKEIDTIVVSCMDRDMAHAAWEMERFEGLKNVWMVSMAGGVVQSDGERYRAMQAISDWLFEKAKAGAMPRMNRVIVMDHNHTCGAVKVWNNKEPLVDLIKRVTGKEAQVREFEENTVMTALIRHGAKVWNQFRLIPGVMFAVGLFDTQRNGEGKPAKIINLTSDGFMLSVEDLQEPDKIKKILGVS